MSIWIWILIAAVAALLAAEKWQHQGLKALSKLTASTAFVALALERGAIDDGYGQAVLVALILSWIGDACLLSQRAAIFMGGIVSFLLGHVGFSVAFVIRGQDWLWFAGGLLGMSVFAWLIDRWLRPQVEANFKGPVRAYIAVITCMASLAFGSWGAGHTWLIPAGATAFFLSDITVALDRFVEERWRNRLVGLPLYYGAQVLLALSVGA